MKKFWLAVRDVVVILLWVIVAQVLAQVVLGLPQIAFSTLKNNHLYILTVYVLAPLGYLFLFYYGFVWLKKHFYHHDFPAISFPVRIKGRYLAYGLLLYALILCGSWIAGLKVAMPALNHWDFTQNLVSEALMFFAAPFVEEVAFRGVIIEQVARRYNLIAGVIVSSLLFGLVHLLNGPLNIISAIQLVLSGALMGCLLSLIYLYEGSIWADYTVHAFYNLFFTLVPIQASVTHDWPFQLIFSSHRQLITGGQYGSDCSLAFNVAYLLMIGLFLFLLKKHRGAIQSR
ncbi:CPBP family intramembrane glutamic endopeptidase [Limosilactobacillus kribbianus]|uniref:CPBP family intramembrane glutamic endopeptidase n=1 Tax=Limosilactobacillus kribbianus TaxID=2982695 RepID=UPI002264ED73|nr:type II CAAX endopeptidase family protein [Limosilactobacillus kribbianus]